MIPTIESCFLVIERYKMLSNIRAHSVLVAGIAGLLAENLSRAGFDISLEKTAAAALLHDIGKTESLRTGENHSEIGKRICIENGFEEIAEIVNQHVRLTGYERNGNITEREIVYYSDKRVNHDHIVSLEERLEYILERYGRGDPPLCNTIKENFSLCKEIEDKIFSHLNFGPDRLSEMVGGHRAWSIE